MRSASVSVLGVLLPTLLPALVAAEPAAAVTAASADAAPGALAVGFRVGGYGFRREGDPRPGAGWTECRMNGVGVFVQRDLRGPLFVEGGLDAYFTQALIMASPATDLPVDRLSGLLGGAIGVRTQLTAGLRAYVQLGAGVELTRVSVPYGTDGTTIRADKALPEGFFGIGGDLRVGRGTYVGATMRMLVMGNFNYDSGRLQMGNAWVQPPTADQVFAASPDMALQGQFYVRRSM